MQKSILRELSEDDLRANLLRLNQALDQLQHLLSEVQTDHYNLTIQKQVLMQTLQSLIPKQQSIFSSLRYTAKSFWAKMSKKTVQSQDVKEWSKISKEFSLQQMEKVIKNFNLLSMIFNFLDLKDIARFGSTCKLFLEQLQQPHIWKQVFLRASFNMWPINQITWRSVCSVMQMSSDINPQKTVVNVGIVGLLGRIQPEPSASERLKRSGLFGSFNNFFLDQFGCYQMACVSVPSIAKSELIFPCIEVWVLQINTQRENWVQEFFNNLEGIRKFFAGWIVVLVNAGMRPAQLEEIDNCIVIVVDLLRDEIVEEIARQILWVYRNSEKPKFEFQPQKMQHYKEQEEPEKKKKKCVVI